LVDNRGLRRALAAAVGLCSLLGGFALSPVLPSAQAQESGPTSVPGRYIVVLKDEVVNSGAAATELARRHGLGLGHIYGAALKGFAATIPDARVPTVSSDPLVKYVEPDAVIALDPAAQSLVQAPERFTIASSQGHQPPPAQSAQLLPTGVRRIGANQSSTWLATAGGAGVNVDVAVISSGIDLSHPDLNVVGGAVFVKAKSYNDGFGDGTLEAGIIGARNNGIGVVGVAPGARLWAVKVTDDSGSGTLSSFIAGINWVVQNGQIKVANLGIFPGGTYQSFNDAVTGAVNHGVTMVVPAGTASMDAANFSPANAPGALTVATLADSDGLPGGLGPVTPYGPDDTFATISDYSNDPNMVAMIAPGVSIYSTWIGASYTTMTNGFCAPAHVAGAVALYLSTHPGATPDAVRTALITAPGVQQIAGIHGETRTYPLVNVSSF
jgi:hypothetical protein